MNRDPQGPYQPSFDIARALSTTGGDAQLLKELIKLFIDDYPELLSELRAAIADKNEKRLETTAHKLKGSISCFGAAEAVESALSLETLGRLGDLRGAGQALAALEEVFGRLLRDFQRYEQEGSLES